MNDSKYLKPNFLLFSLLTFLSNGLIYIIQFFLNKEKVDYFVCTSINTYSFNFFSNSLQLIYPESCDLKPYAVGIVNLNSYYDLTEFVYQDRPLFVLYIAIFFNLIKALSFSTLSTYTILKISFFLGQLFLTSLICIYLLKLFDLVNLNIGSKYFILPLLVSVSPLFKWHIFESTSMTFTFFIFIIGIYIFINNKNINLPFYFFGIGLLFLIHRSAILILLFFVINIVIDKSISKEKILSTLYFFIPVIFYYISLFASSGFYDHQAEDWRQFIWVLDFLQGKETLQSGYFCQSPKLAIKCYVNDLIILSKYMAIPALACLSYIVLNFININEAVMRVIRSAIIFTLIINLFWLFIGWYPPIRFSYYGFGNFIIFISILIFFNLQNNISQSLFISGYLFYFILLNHWNSPLVVEPNQLIRTSIFLFVGAIFAEYSYRHQ
tara:strand:+ start:35285 stop:36598 length:1314 start_codon:yes stop_codon:yes gene_type:complete